MSRLPTGSRGHPLFPGKGVLAILDWGNLPSEREILLGARELARGGVEIFQLRAKRLEDRRFVPLAMELRRVLRGRMLTTNDRADIAAVSGADGVHLGMDDLPAGAARAMLGERALIGVSGGNPGEISLQARSGADYLSIGPVFSTRTKVDAGKPLGCPGFRRLAAMAPRHMRLLAVGGITPDNVGCVVDCGADAVAAASWWWKGERPERAARRMLEAVAEAGKKCGRTRKGRRLFGGPEW